MSHFAYRAIAGDGRESTGTIEAESAQLALALLRQKKLHPFELKAGIALQRARTASLWRRPGETWRANFYHQFSLLLAAGITSDKALRILEEQATQRWEKQLLAGLHAQLIAGTPFSRSWAEAAPHLHAYEASLLNVGEQSGSLVPALADLSTALERNSDLKGRVGSALIYPLFLLLLAPASLIVVTTILVPNIAPLFENSDAKMPAILSAMISVHRLMTDWPFLFWLGIVSVVVLLCAAILHPRMRRSAKEMLKSLPILSGISLSLQTSRICRILGGLIKGNAPLQSALSSLENSFDAPGLKNALSRIRSSVSAGQPLSASFKRERILVSGVAEMIAVGEETNQLPALLLNAAELHERDAIKRIERLMTLLVPILTLLMGLLVGGIVLSVMRAILAVNQLAVE